MNINRIVPQLKKLGVELLVQFGSQVEGRARPESDVDIGVSFIKNVPAPPRRHGQVYAYIQELFPGQRVDLVELEAASYPFQFKVASKGVPLYEASPASFADFRERAMLRYFDFQPILRIHEEALQIV